jgi:tRNA pseudouridine65 synthase
MTSSTENACSASPLKILHRDERLAVIDKPAGMMVHRTKIASRETVFLVDVARELFGRKIFPVHRLDRGTSGAMLIAFDAETASELGAQMMAGGISKRYLAICRGWIPGPILVDKPLGKVRDEAPGGADEEKKPARTRFLPIELATVPVASAPYESTRLSLIEALPEHGRRHQIRRHLKAISHPIIGDATYGKGPLNRALAEYFGGGRLFLHSASIRFAHPATGDSMLIEAPLSGLFANVAEKLKALSEKRP